LFCTDLTSTQIAEVAKINRNTINRILQLLHKRIVEIAEKESCFEAGEIEVDESYFGAKRVRGKRGRGAGGKMKVFGIKKRGDKVYTQIVNNCSASELVPIIKRLAPDDSTIYSDEWKAYDGLVNAGYKKHYRVRIARTFSPTEGLMLTASKTSGVLPKTDSPKCVVLLGRTSIFT